MSFRSPISAVIAFAVFATASSGSWLETTGTTELRNELGSAAPTGAGVRVLQAEATSVSGTEEDPVYHNYPQAGGPASFAGSGNYLGVTFIPQSGERAASGHAGTVASRWYGRSAGISTGTTDVVVFSASDYINDIGGLNGANSSERVHNHSWIATQSATNTATLLQAIIDDADALVAASGSVLCVGLNNGGANNVPPVFGHCYNALVVGRTDKIHSYGTTKSGYTGEGRMKPDLVADDTATSWATGQVSGVATLLLETIDSDPSISAADTPTTIKAVILSGADKNFSAEWDRANQGDPYDTVFGAGSVNVYNSYHVLKGGEQSPSASVPANLKGWANLDSSTTRQFLLRVPIGLQAEELSVTLCWQREQDGGDEERADLSLQLFRVVSGGANELVDQSVSDVDNVEHVYRRNLEAGDYLIEVPAVAITTGLAGLTTGPSNYSLAWRVELGNGPDLTETAPGVLNFSGLDPAASYEVKRSTTLVGGWTTVGNLPAAARFVDSFTDPSPPAGRAFYRLEWSDPVTPAAPAP